MQIVKTDGGAAYTLRDHEDGRLIVTGSRTGIQWEGVGNRLDVTGKERRHGALGLGKRCVLTLDLDGEGDECNIRGVLLTPTPLPD